MKLNITKSIYSGDVKKNVTRMRANHSNQHKCLRHLA